MGEKRTQTQRKWSDLHKSLCLLGGKVRQTHSEGTKLQVQPSVCNLLLLSLLKHQTAFPWILMEKPVFFWFLFYNVLRSLLVSPSLLSLLSWLCFTETGSPQFYSTSLNVSCPASSKTFFYYLFMVSQSQLTCPLPLWQGTQPWIPHLLIIHLLRLT